MSREEEAAEARKEHAARLHEAWDAQDDWWGRCRRCGQKVSGKPQELRKHVCQTPDSGRGP